MDKDMPPPYNPNLPYPAQQNSNLPPYPVQEGHPPIQQYAPYPPVQQAYHPPAQQPFPAMQGDHGALMGAQAAAGGILKNNVVVGSDDPVEGMGGFDDKAIRRGFIRKVYGILMCQLAVTGALIAIIMFVHPVKMYVRENMWTLYTSMAITLVCLLIMVCSERARRKAPANFIFLSIFTVCEGFMLGVTATLYDADAVLIAVGITCGVTFALTLFAFQTKWDFTTCGGMLCSILVIFMIAGVIMAFLPQSKYTMIGYGSAGALIFSLYLVYDTQLMLGGKHKYSLSPEEYVFASLNLYLDIINLFLYILMIVGAAKKD